MCLGCVLFSVWQYSAGTPDTTHHAPVWCGSLAHIDSRTCRQRTDHIDPRYELPYLPDDYAQRWPALALTTRPSTDVAWPRTYIEWDSSGYFASKVLHQFGWQAVDQLPEATWVWLDDAGTDLYWEDLLPHQRVSTVLDDAQMTTKASLARNLRRHYYDAWENDPLHRPDTYGDLFRLIQPTWRLHDPVECRQIVDWALAGRLWSIKWIVKATHLSMGRDTAVMASIVEVLHYLWYEDKIDVCWTDAEMRQLTQQYQRYRRDQNWLAAPTQCAAINTSHWFQAPDVQQAYLNLSRTAPWRTCDRGYVLQQYIEHPLLLNGYKSETRLYWLIASTSPWVVYAHEGVVRLNSKKYDLGNWHDPLSHITNVHRQKDHPDMKDPEFKQALKWNYRMYGHYLHRQGLVAQPDWPHTHLLPLLHAQLRRAFVACLPQLEPLHGTFALFGADFILDEQLWPWLTELQIGPGMSTSGVKMEVLPDMMRSALNIVAELSQQDPPMDLSQVQAGNWTLIYDETHTQ